MVSTCTDVPAGTHLLTNGCYGTRTRRRHCLLQVLRHPHPTIVKIRQASSSSFTSLQIYISSVSSTAFDTDADYRASSIPIEPLANYPPYENPSRQYLATTGSMATSIYDPGVKEKVPEPIPHHNTDLQANHHHRETVPDRNTDHDSSDLESRLPLSQASSDSNLAPDSNNEDENFPDGGLRAWSVIFGAWCAFFCVMGIFNCAGVFVQVYSEDILKDQSLSTISWIPALQGFAMDAITAFVSCHMPRYLCLGFCILSTPSSATRDLTVHAFINRSAAHLTPTVPAGCSTTALLSSSSA